MPTLQRRRFVQAAVAAPALPVLLAQPPARPGSELPKIETITAAGAGQTVASFFSPQQLATLRRLGDIILPPIGQAPGASDAGAAGFLDFLLSKSPAERQKLYTTGLDLLDRNAQQRYSKSFDKLDDAQANTLLEPLRAAWTFDPPADPLARFLREAKADIRTATLNSREYAAANRGSSGRRFSGTGLYWHPLD